MISNYLKLAWRVLWRNKFFTLISLFGISFTLTVLMLFVSIFQSELGENAPLGQADDLMYLPSLALEKVFYDTIPQIDSIGLDDNTFRYDTTFEYKSRGSMITRSDMSKQLLTTHFNDIPSVKSSTMINLSTFDVFVRNNKLAVDAVYTDEQYWEVFDFEFLEGRSFDKKELEKNNPIIVITEDFGFDYFGVSTNNVGKMVKIGGKQHEVIGVVKTPTVSRAMGYSVSRDVFIPHSLMSESYTEEYYFGGFHAVFLKRPEVTLATVKQDLLFASEQIPLDHPDNLDGFNEVNLVPASLKATLANQLMDGEKPEESLRLMTWVLISLLSLFVLLPMLNLINLNVSRIMDRASEIGVRKSFGAEKSNILTQFIVENIVLTMIGAAIAFGFTLIVMSLINGSDFLGPTELSFNPSFFFVSLIVCLLFGILSGMLPAWRMAKLNIVDALKKNKV